MKKRIISVLTVLTILLGMLCIPTNAVTEESQPTDTEETPSTSRVQCECGGKAKNKVDHVCQDITFEPWTDSTSLPHSGNIYLETDVTLDRRDYVAANSELHIDLNGHKIVRKVTGPITEETLSHVFLVGFEEPTFARLTITDSTDTPGSISRNTSALSEEDLEKVFNYGLITYMEHCTGDMTLYGGILDTKNDSSISYGSAVYCYTDDCTFKMYGGEILGGTAKSTIFSHGKVELYGGEIRNGCTTDRTTGAVSVSASGSLILGGDVKIYENTYKPKISGQHFCET